MRCRDPCRREPPRTPGKTRVGRQQLAVAASRVGTLLLHEPATNLRAKLRLVVMLLAAIRTYHNLCSLIVYESIAKL